MRRLGRIVAGLLLVLVVTPMAVLGPLFWLDEQLPAEAGLRAARGGIMALVLITLVLVVAVNVVGSSSRSSARCFVGRAAARRASNP